MIKIDGLRKEYDKTVALNGLCLQIDEGDIFGFIGPNGAGKTTTMNLLAGLIQPTSGTASIAGYDLTLQIEQIKRIIGYMPDFFGMYDDLKVWEYLDFFARAYSLPKDKRREAVENTLDMLKLGFKRDEYVGSLSRGMKQKLCLCRALINDPLVLLLDEPMSGLDPLARIEVKELFAGLREMKKTIFVSSHILPELAQICNKIGIIEKGILLAGGTVDEVIRQTAVTRNFRLKTASDPEEVVRLISKLEKVSRVRPLRIEETAPLAVENEVIIECADDIDPAQLLEMCILQKIKVIAFYEEKDDIEAVFKQISTGSTT